MSSIEQPQLYHQKEGGEQQRPREQEQKQEEQQIQVVNWQAAVAPYLLMFKVQPRDPFHAGKPVYLRKYFEDQYENFIYFGHTSVLCYAPRLLKMLRTGETANVEIDDVDKGSLAYTLLCRDGFFVLMETRVELYGWCGRFMSFVVVLTLDPLKEWLENQIKHCAREM